MTAEVGPAPRSWAEDLNSYRASRGSCSFSTVHQAGTPARYSRTNYAPFCDTKHSMYSYNEFVDPGPGKVDPKVQEDRRFRHGWGDTSLLKEDGFSGTIHPRGHQKQQGTAPAPSPRAKDGRHGMFGVLQMSEAGGVDSWIGNSLIDPTKGKRANQPPVDPKGRKDLFEVLQARQPGKPADDSWLGNSLIDPAKGKASAAGPEQLRGRRDLTDIFNMSILKDPNRLELLNKGADPLGDAWVGNTLIDARKGKQPVHGVAAAEEVMQGSTFKCVPDNWTDNARRHTKMVDPPYASTAKMVMTGEISDVDWGKSGRKPMPERVNEFDGRKDLYANMTYRPLTDKEQKKYSNAWDDSGVHGKGQIHPVPGNHDGAKGFDMLHWKPEARLGNFVPRGGMMQETRKPRRGNSR